MGSAFHRLLWVAAAGLWLPACNSTPTLPLPPPVATVHAPEQQSVALVEGDVNPRAFVFVFNERTEGGVITRADTDGRFQVEVEASIGDLLTIWQQVDDQTGERKETVVPGR